MMSLSDTLERVEAGTVNEGVSRNDLNVGEITWRNVPGQEFVPSGDHLCGIEILLATFARKNTCRLVFKLLQASYGLREEVRSAEVAGEDLEDNTWHTFRFPAVADSGNKTFYFSIESPDGEPGNALTLWASATESPPGHQMHINHQPVPGALCFRPVYASPPVRAYQDEWEHWGEWETTALAMMDGSRTEEDLRQRGQAVVQVLGRALAVDETHRVLEIGCGVGRVLREMAPRAAHITGVDISANLLAIAKRRIRDLENVDLVHLGEKTLHEFPDHSFDRIYAHIVFFHLPREQIFDHLKETARLLRPGGRAYFDTWNFCHPAGFERWEREVRQYRGREKPRAFNRFHTRAEMECLLDHAGLRPRLVVEGPLLCIVASPAARAGEESLAFDDASGIREMLYAVGEEYLKSEPHDDGQTEPA